jgi:hypothetical protein
VIRGPTIEREVITHYRDVDHGKISKSYCWVKISRLTNPRRHSSTTSQSTATTAAASTTTGTYTWGRDRHRYLFGEGKDRS